MIINTSKSEIPFNNSIINQLYNKALESVIENKLAATILKSNKMITKPYCNSLSTLEKETNMASLHAEAHAIIKYYGKSFYYNKNKDFVYLDEKKNKNIDLLVIRINKAGSTCNARPCYNCLNMMKAVGIKKVYYSITLMSDNNNNDYLPIKLICENVEDMISIQTSAINRYLDFNYLDDFIKNKYYDNLLKKIFPSYIKINNLNYFIEFNLIKILPDYQAKIINEKGNKYVYILNNNNNIIVKANII